MRRVMTQDKVDKLISAYRAMRKYGLQKGRGKEDLIKSTMVDFVFGYDTKIEIVDSNFWDKCAEKVNNVLQWVKDKV